MDAEELGPKTTAAAVRRSGKGGRPRAKLPPLHEVESLAAKGLTQGQIALTLGIGRGTFYRHKRWNREFREACERGHAKGVALVANALFEAALGGNVVAMIFWLKSRAQWRDVVQVEAELKVAPQADRQERLKVLRAMTPEERRQIREIFEEAHARLAKSATAEPDSARQDLPHELRDPR